MMTSFTRNYEDNSTEAGFQFTFYCDVCNDGFKTSFLESETQKKNAKLRGISQGAWAVGSLFGNKLGELGWAMGRGADALSERFNGMSSEWQKEHEHAFNQAQNEAKQHFQRCHGCNKWACNTCFNEEEAMCTECAPRESVSVAKAKAEALRRNLNNAASQQTVWKGKLESQTLTCPSCGKPASGGKFCNNCGASLKPNTCPQCGSVLSEGARFCGECGSKINGGGHE